MQIQHQPSSQPPEWVAEMVAELRPRLTTGTQVVLKAEEDPAFKTENPKDELVVPISQSVSVKNLSFDTDGEFDDAPALKFKDGTCKNRTVRNWNWVIVENAVNGSDGTSRTVKVCYVKDPDLLLALKTALGQRA